MSNAPINNDDCVFSWFLQITSRICCFCTVHATEHHVCYPQFTATFPSVIGSPERIEPPISCNRPLYYTPPRNECHFSHIPEHILLEELSESGHNSQESYTSMEVDDFGIGYDGSNWRDMESGYIFTGHPYSM
ncbi:hypothetical protein INT48_002634 [Thamnidium elegans]|uniref:Uncharacterized protein n=1 Tax=Thamnidium elegans TaxID=101142 RepID=A0A8H7SZJ8_9FUNG|nr:hypothetical protein INT48_002634 [Thamnidium elegans]